MSESRWGGNKSSLSPCSKGKNKQKHQAEWNSQLSYQELDCNSKFLQSMLETALTAVCTAGTGDCPELYLLIQTLKVWDLCSCAVPPFQYLTPWTPLFFKNLFSAHRSSLDAFFTVCKISRNRTLKKHHGDPLELSSSWKDSSHCSKCLQWLRETGSAFLAKINTLLD